MVYIIGTREQIFNYIRNEPLTDEQGNEIPNISDIYYQLNVVFGDHEDIYFVITQDPNTQQFKYYGEGDLEDLKEEFEENGEEAIYLDDQQQQGGKSKSRKGKSKSRKGKSRKNKTHKRVKSILLRGGKRKNKKSKTHKNKSHKVTFGKNKVKKF
jgi:septum formation inhibitor MinC